MPKRSVLQPVGRADEARDELRDGIGVDLSLGGLSVRAGDLPLFRRSGDGKLLQVLRLVLRASTDMGEVSLTVSDNGAELDRKTLRVTPGRHSVHFLIPEVKRAGDVLVRLGSEFSTGPVEGAVPVTPQRKWSVSVIHHSHLDIGYTDPQSMVLRHHLSYLDSVLDLVSSTDDSPDDARFRWNIEAHWPLQRWLEVRPSTDCEAFLERVRQGRIEVTALPFSMHTEAFSTDELARQLIYADELRTRFRLPITTAMQTDVPGAAIGLLNLLLDADIGSLAVAHNYAGRSTPYLVDGQELTRPFYWQSESGKKLLVWYTDTPHGMAYMEGNIVGLTDGYSVAIELVPEYLAALANKPYPFTGDVYGWGGLPDDVEVTKDPYPYDLLHLRVQSTIADNAPPSLTLAETVREWNSHWVYPQLRVATNREFFTGVREEIGDRLETYSGDWTNWWADGIGSAARSLGFNRRAQSEVRVGRTIHVLADVVGGQERPATDPVERTYASMALFDEHTWGAANPWTDGLDKMQSGSLQWERKAAFATDAYEQSGLHLEEGIHRLSHVFGSPASSLASVTVFNPGSSDRSDIVSSFVPFTRIDGNRSFSMVDAHTQQRVPYTIREQQHSPFRPAGRFIDFIARDVPSCGYVRFDLVESTYRSDPSRTPAEPVIENEHYFVEIDPFEGCATRFIDKQTGRDLINGKSPFGFNQYIHDRYATAPHFNHLSGRITATNIALLGERSVGRFGVITDRFSSPIEERMVLHMEGDGVNWIETSLRLLHGVKRLDIVNRIGKVGTSEKESVFFAFPFAVDDPSVTYEVTGGVSSPCGPHVPGSARHMRAIRHWVSIQGADVNVAWATMEAPLIELGNIALPYAPFPETLDPDVAHPATVFSWALNNIWDTNFPSKQAGEMMFSYAVATSVGAGARELAMRTAASLTMPLLAILSQPGNHDDMSPQGTFCVVDRNDIEVVGLGPSRAGHDITLLLQSAASEHAEVRLAFPMMPIARAFVGNHLERGMTEIAINGGQVALSVYPGQLAAVALDLATTSAAQESNR